MSSSPPRPTKDHSPRILRTHMNDPTRIGRFFSPSALRPPVPRYNSSMEPNLSITYELQVQAFNSSRTFDSSSLKMSTSNSKFIHLRANTSDLPSISEMMYSSFHKIPAVQQLIMGGNPKLFAGMLEESMKNDPTDIWMKVVERSENSEGRLVGAAQWKLYLTPGGGNEMSVPQWLEGETKKAAEKVIGGMNRNRMETNEEAYLCEYRLSGEKPRQLLTFELLDLHICFVDNAYQGRGLGSMMVKWGCELADLLGISSHVEGSVDGRRLYEKHGYFVEGEPIMVDGVVCGLNMRRPIGG